MRRKDILIISAVFILIVFGTVFVMYYAINGGNIFSKIAEEIEEIAETKKEYHSNGWETAIVDEIKYDVPIPVGFKYVEGKEDTGIIIENINSGEKYMWIPNQEINTETYEKIMVSSELNFGTSEETESIQKYNGFYIAIDERSNEEKFEEYLKENTKDFETYYELKQLGYEAYKNKYKETTGEEFDLNSIGNIIDDNIKLNNVSKTEAVETHTSTKEELACIASYKEKIENSIKIKDYKTLMLLSQSSANNTKTYEEVINKIRDYNKRIENAIKYVSDIEEIKKSKIKSKINEETDNAYDDIINVEGQTIDDNFNSELLYEMDTNTEKAYTKIKSAITNNYCMNNSKNKKELKRILDTEADYEKLKQTIENKEKTAEEFIDTEADYEKLKQTIENKEKIAEESIDADGKVVYIPKGFEHETGTTVATGYKIKNTDNLSFIWIPVDDVDIIKEKFVEKAKEAQLDNSIIDEYEKYEYEIDNELIKSIKTYGGFYISEAELGYDENGNVINKFRSMYERGEWAGYNYVTNGDYYRNVNESNYYDENTVVGKKQREFKLTYDNAVKECQELFSDSETVSSHLTNGLEYDATVLYLLEKGVITVEQAFKDSTEIGKYRGTEEKQSIWEKESYLNGIYGLAGNLSEVTQEKDGENIILRGGSWYTTGNSKPIASKEAISENEMDKGENDEGNEIILGSVGIRACLYIKTEYIKNEELTNEKQKAKSELKRYIQDETILKLKGNDTDFFNNEYDETSKTYKMVALNNIVKYIEEKIDAETSSASFGKIIQYGKDEINNIRDNIVAMIEYPKDVEGYTYGETSDECWAIKEETISKMEGLSWNAGIITNAEGKETPYADVRIKAEKDIEEIRNAYKNRIIKEYIDDYPTATDKDYTKIIKTKAKEETYYTNDLDNLINITVKYQEIIEVAYKFDKTGPNSWDYYESWKNVYASIKKEYVTKIANEANNKEEATAIATEGMWIVNKKSSAVIEKKEKEADKKSNNK